MTIDDLKHLWHQEDLDDIKTVASTAAGRRLLGRVFHQCRMFETIPPNDALVMAFNEGQRNVGNMLMCDLLAVCPEKFISMQKAAKDRQVSRKRQLEVCDDYEENEI